MATLYNYLLRYSDKSFDEMYLNEIDVLLLNELSYFPFDNYVTQAFDLEQAFDLSKLYKVIGPSLPRMHQFQTMILTKYRIELFQIMANSPRYSNIKLYAFHNQISLDIELQFSALCFDIPNHYTLVSFRGTDDSIIGWKEDAYMAFQPTIPAQQMAANYLNLMPTQQDKPLILSGHSKGGNLVVFAASKAKTELQEHIQIIFSFDGPGFQPLMNISEDMHLIEDRVVHIIPEDSIVGRMLEYNIPPVIIKSRKTAFSQHEPINWVIEDNHFQVIEKTSDFSQLVDLSIKAWTAELSPSEMKEFVDISFDLIDLTKIKHLEEINQNKLGFFRHLRSQIHNLDEDSRQMIKQVSLRLIQIFRDMFKEYRNESLLTIKDQVEQWFKIT